MKRANLRRTTSTRLFFLRTFVVLFLLVTIALPACSQQFDYIDGKKPFELDNIYIPGFFLNNNSVSYYYENKKENSLVTFQSYFSGRNRRFNIEAPLLTYRSKSMDLAAGYQVTGNTVPFIGYIPFGGLRAAGYFKNSGIMGYYGNSNNVTNWVVMNPDMNRYNLSGLLYRRQFGDYTAVQLGLHRFNITSNPKSTSTLQVLSLATSPLTGFNAKVTMGRDSRMPGFWNRSNTALDWQVNLFSGSLSVNSYGKRVGRNFGPPVFLNFDRGTDNSSTYVSYRLSNKLTADASLQRYIYQNPDLTVPGFGRSYASGGLRWQISNNLQLGAGVQREKYYNEVDSKIQLQNIRREYYTELQWRSKKFNFQAALRSYTDKNMITGQTLPKKSQQASLTYNLTPNQEVSLSYNNYQYYDSQTTSFLGSKNLGFRYRNTFSRDKGFISLDLNQYQDFDPFLGIPVRNQSQSLAVEYWFTKTWNVTGQCYRSVLPNKDPINSFRVATRYIFSDNSDVNISYSTNPFESIYYIQGRQYRYKNVFFVQFRQSFGGPLNDEFVHRRACTIGGRVYYYPKGNPNDKKIFDPSFTPVNFELASANNPVVTANTNGQSIAYFGGLKPGHYELRIDESKLDKHFRIIDKSVREIGIAPGREVTTDYILEANSSLYVVAWNDVLGKGQLDPVYAGFDGLKVELDGSNVAETNLDGIAIFSDIAPGTHTVRLIPESLPKGITYSTDKVLSLDLPAGKETVALFGLQGWGFMSGKVYVVPIGKTVDMRIPVNNFNIYIDGNQAAKSEQDGSYRARIPAGNHVFSINTYEYAGSAYSFEDEKQRIKIDTAVESQKDINLAFYGKIKGQLQEEVDGKLIPLKESGIVINFSADPGYMYTDERGEYVFDKLKIGTYTVSIDKTYVPKGCRLVSPENVTVTIDSGETKTVPFIFKKGNSGSLSPDTLALIAKLSQKPTERPRTIPDSGNKNTAVVATGETVPAKAGNGEGKTESATKPENSSNGIDTTAKPNADESKNTLTPNEKSSESNVNSSGSSGTEEKKEPGITDSSKSVDSSIKNEQIQKDANSSSNKEIEDSAVQDKNQNTNQEKSSSSSEESQKPVIQKDRDAKDNSGGLNSSVIDGQDSSGSDTFSALSKI